MMRILFLLASTSLVAECSPYDRFLGGFHHSSSPMTKDPKMAEVANILKGILSNLTKHKGYFNQLNSELSKQLSPDLKNYLGKMGVNMEDAVNSAVPELKEQAPEVKKHVTMALAAVVQVHKTA